MLKVIIGVASKNKDSVKGARIGKTEIDMSQRKRWVVLFGSFFILSALKCVFTRSVERKSDQKKVVRVMVIKKILNNSSAVVEDDGIEKIILGKGIVFGKKNGDFIDSNSIEKMFITETENEKKRLMDLIQKIPDHCISIVEEIVDYAESILKGKLNSSIHLTLADHISFLLERYEKHILPTNALKYDIKRCYTKEYRIAEKAVELLEDEYDIKLNDDEIASIAMHIVNAEFDSTMQEGTQIVQIVDHIVQIIRYYLHVDIDMEDIHYQRLLTHLRFFVWRVIKNQQEENDNTLYDIVKSTYPKAHQCTLRIKQFIEDTYNYAVSDDECTYLTVHIQRLLELQNT